MLEYDEHAYSPKLIQFGDVDEVNVFNLFLVFDNLKLYGTIIEGAVNNC